MIIPVKYLYIKGFHNFYFLSFHDQGSHSFCECSKLGNLSKQPTREVKCRNRTGTETFQVKLQYLVHQDIQPLYALFSGTMTFASFYNWCIYRKAPGNAALGKLC